MKAKLSVTLDEALVSFIDAQPGATRSEKIERIISRYRRVRDDVTLREELARFGAGGHGDDAEAEAWRRTMEEDQWRGFDAATSGRSSSSRSRSRGRR